MARMVMLFEPREKIAGTLVKILAASPGSTASCLHCAVLDRLPACSTAALYKELRKLLDSGVIVKISGRYSLSLTWILQMISFSEALEDRYLRAEMPNLVLPAAGEKTGCSFTSLLRVNDFSSHVILLLTSRAESKIVYSWNPHPWFYLVQGRQEAGYIEALRLTGGRFWKVIGGTAYLDRWTERFWEGKTTRYAFTGEPFERDRSLYYNVVGDYIASFKLDARSTAVIEKLYSSVRNSRQLEAAEVFSLLCRRCSAKFRIENNAQKAAAYRRKFHRFFGPE